MSGRSSSTSACRRFIVAGRVQGVAYRAWTCEQAVRLGLAGWARNLCDGSVEVVARGNPEAIERLLVALNDGPAAARVTSVDEAPMESAPDAAIRTFRIR